MSNCSGLLGRTSLRQQPDGVDPVCQVAELFRPSRPDFIETQDQRSSGGMPHKLFRPSRPDFIETCRGGGGPIRWPDCSGLLGRTSLRLEAEPQEPYGVRLFRPSRPDFIETTFSPRRLPEGSYHCSGLLGRTSLRLGVLCLCERITHMDCSGLLGRTSLRQRVHRSANILHRSIVPAF